MKKGKINRLHIGLLAILIILGATSIDHPKDVYSQVVQLTSAHGSCSGEQIKTQSGNKYILTAAHCRVLDDNGSITVHTEDGRTLKRRIIATDTDSDLMLLEAVPGLDGMTLADSLHPREHVQTFTHGSGYPTYKTEGVVIDNLEIKVLLGYVSTPEDEAKCTGKIYSIETISSFFGDIRACIFTSIETATTAMIVPGSSGGPVVNDNHELVGVVSAGDQQAHFGFLVTLKDIRAFLSNY